ncbi:hypothetical protein Klosneuvirus_4_39 [Klosneuvirus KNV1]|uniref:Uncharacterized protein n=1 Tax=Klosneuvirus KNV1 TaxID=1977640 RepID=A0A1V0SKS4_9VIRU|nr:hypothetical protein Klosneuvirus_4_39 [Klosneuvirus KNV1]
MDNQVLGLNATLVVVALLLIILGVVTFHYHAYVNAGGRRGALNAGMGARFSILPHDQ